MPINEKIAWIIRSSREQHGYSQEYMAEMLHVVQSTYAAIESGKTAITVDRLNQIAELLALNPCDVIRQCIENNVSARAKLNQQNLLPESKDVYEKLITELKEEIFFLRGMIKNEIMRD